MDSIVKEISYKNPVTWEELKDSIDLFLEELDVLGSDVEIDYLDTGSSPTLIHLEYIKKTKELIIT